MFYADNEGNITVTGELTPEERAARARIAPTLGACAAAMHFIRDHGPWTYAPLSVHVHHGSARVQVSEEDYRRLVPTFAGMAEGGFSVCHDGPALHLAACLDGVTFHTIPPVPLVPMPHWFDLEDDPALAYVYPMGPVSEPRP